MRTNITTKIFTLILVSVFILTACQQGTGNSGNGNLKGCTKDAKICPDGSYVGRTGPNCEFAPCNSANGKNDINNFDDCVKAGYPVGESYPRQCWTKDGKRFVEQVASVGTIQSGTANASVSSSEEYGLYNYTDLPLSSISASMSVKFLAEHRSALNGQIVNVKGIIVSTLLGEAACPNSGVAEFCAQPRITIADTASDSRDKNYDVIVLLPEDDSNYKINQSVEIKGTVVGSKTDVLITKTY